MEYATNICTLSRGDELAAPDRRLRSDQYIRHVGYVENDAMKEFYGKKNIDRISSAITERLQGVDKYNRNIVVPDITISSIMSSVYENFRPETGDIYSRYNIPKGFQTDYIRTMTDEVINIITTDVKVNIGMDDCNSKLSLWTTVLGNFNEHGLRSHPPIKLREKRPMPCAFNMNY